MSPLRPRGSRMPRGIHDGKGGVDAPALDENLREIERLLDESQKLKSDTPPVPELILDQVGDVLSMIVIVHDVGNNWEGYVRFKTLSGPGDFDITDPTDGSWTTDAIAPFVATVTLEAKHGGIIAVAIPYKNLAGELLWRIERHRGDADQDAELTGHECAFDTAGYPLVSLTMDEDGAKAYLRGAAGADIAAATPGDPSSGTKDATLATREGTVKLDGTGGTTARQTAMGELFGYKVVCENRDGAVNPLVFGPYFQRRGDSKTLAPRVRVTAVRSSSTVAFDLAIDDPTKSVTAIEFRKREDGGSLSAYASTWDRTNGSVLGTAVAHTRGEDVTSSPGLDSQFCFRVTWIDELNNPQYIEDSLNASRLETIAGIPLLFPNTLAGPAQQSTTWNNGASFLRGDTAGVSQFFVLPLVLPAGITITELALRGSRADATNDKMIATVFKVDDVGTTSTLATLTHDTTGDQTKTGSLFETTSSSYHYSAILEIKGAAGVGDAVFRWVRVTYTRPSYDKTY